MYEGRRDEEFGDDQNREPDTTPTHNLLEKKSPRTGNRYPRSRRRLVGCGEMGERGRKRCEGTELRWKKLQGEVDGRLGTHRTNRWRAALLS
jgi:hypothetical protein